MLKKVKKRSAETKRLSSLMFFLEIICGSYDSYVCVWGTSVAASMSTYYHMELVPDQGFTLVCPGLYS